jgi:hypothetical protein
MDANNMIGKSFFHSDFGDLRGVLGVLVEKSKTIQSYLAEIIDFYDHRSEITAELKIFQLTSQSFFK